MAQGTLTLFEEFSEDMSDGTHDLDTHVYKLALVSDSVTGISAGLATPALTDFTEVTGSGYTAGGNTLTCTWTETGGTATFDATGSPATSWTQNGSGPTNIRTGIIYNNTDTGKAAICFIDMTTDSGTTPISLQDGDISWTPNASGIFTVS